MVVGNELMQLYVKSRPGEAIMKCTVKVRDRLVGVKGVNRATGNAKRIENGGS
jgi:hypothetical protein